MIRLRDVHKVYQRGAQRVRALDGISLSIDRGELLAVTGPSGSGKSTLLHLVGALDTPTSGEVEIAGRALSQLPEQELTLLRRKHIGFVFQFFNLLPNLTATENVMLPALLAGRRAPQARKHAAELLERVGLAHRGEHRPDQLSGGEMQRVAIARALVGDAPLLLADEPTGNLDTATGQGILELLQRLNREGTTIVLGTHDATAAAIAGGVVLLRDGRVVEDTRSEPAASAPEDPTA